jgi:adenylate kinase family enzyme
VQRVLVVGSPGAGKSTLAAEIARRTGLPLIHLDQHYWRAGWVETSKLEWRSRVVELIAGERWIIDGNYSGTLDLRLTRADTLIDLELPVWLCVARVIRRSIGARGRVRADMAEACPERLNLHFLWWTLKYPFTSRRRIDRKIGRFGGRVIKLTSRRRVQRFVDSLSRDGIFSPR